MNSSLYFSTLHISHFFYTLHTHTRTHNTSLLLYTNLHYTSIASLHLTTLHIQHFFYRATLIYITNPSLLLYATSHYTSIISIHHSMLRTYRFFYTLLNITLPPLTLHIIPNCKPISCSVRHSALQYIALHCQSVLANIFVAKIFVRFPSTMGKQITQPKKTYIDGRTCPSVRKFQIGNVRSNTD